MFPGMAQRQQNDVAYSASPTNTARSRGKQVRADDGFHTRPARPERNWRRTIGITLAVVVCAVAAIFALRTVVDPYEGPQETMACAEVGGETCRLSDALDSSPAP